MTYVINDHDSLGETVMTVSVTVSYFNKIMSVKCPMCAKFRARHCTTCLNDVIGFCAMTSSVHHQFF
jgi:hypothetical protein